MNIDACQADMVAALGVVGIALAKTADGARAFRLE
jgi:hypothetical protein